jgi:hypothetical protein
VLGGDDGPPPDGFDEQQGQPRGATGVRRCDRRHVDHLAFDQLDPGFRVQHAGRAHAKELLCGDAMRMRGWQGVGVHDDFALGSLTGD